MNIQDKASLSVLRSEQADVLVFTTRQPCGR